MSLLIDIPGDDSTRHINLISYTIQLGLMGVQAIPRSDCAGWTRESRMTQVTVQSVCFVGNVQKGRTGATGMTGRPGPAGPAGPSGRPGKLNPRHLYPTGNRNLQLSK